MSNLIEAAALARIREVELVDDAKAAEILSDDALIERVVTGPRQARERKGQFVG